MGRNSVVSTVFLSFLVTFQSQTEGTSSNNCYIGVLITEDVTIKINKPPTYQCNRNDCCGKPYYSQNVAGCTALTVGSHISVNTCYGDLLCEPQEGDQRIPCKNRLLCYTWETTDECEERLTCTRMSGCPVPCDVHHLCGPDFTRDQCLAYLSEHPDRLYKEAGFKSEYLINAQQCIERNLCAALNNLCSRDHIKDATNCRKLIFSECKNSLCKLSPGLQFGGETC